MLIAIVIINTGFSGFIDTKIKYCRFCRNWFYRIHDLFLQELHRLLKKNGKFFIRDGHHPREQSKQKIINSKNWSIIEETKGWLVGVPVKSA